MRLKTQTIDALECLYRGVHQVQETLLCAGFLTIGGTQLERRHWYAALVLVGCDDAAWILDTTSHVDCARALERVDGVLEAVFVGTELVEEQRHTVREVQAETFERRGELVFLNRLAGIRHELVQQVDDADFCSVDRHVKVHLDRVHYACDKVVLFACVRALLTKNRDAAQRGFAKRHRGWDFDVVDRAFEVDLLADRQHLSPCGGLKTVDVLGDLVEQRGVEIEFFRECSHLFVLSVCLLLFHFNLGC